MGTKMENQVLSIEQMLVLKGLGVDTSKASMYWDMPHVPDFKHKLNQVGVNGGKFGKYQIGAFTLQDILDMLPTVIYNSRGKAHSIAFYACNEGFESWVIPFDKGKLKGTAIYFDLNVLQVAYNTLLWCCEKKYELSFRYSITNNLGISNATE